MPRFFVLILEAVVVEAAVGICALAVIGAIAGVKTVVGVSGCSH